MTFQVNYRYCVLDRNKKFHYKKQNDAAITGNESQLLMIQVPLEVVCCSKAISPSPTFHLRFENCFLFLKKNMPNDAVDLKNNSTNVRSVSLIRISGLNLVINFNQFEHFIYYQNCQSMIRQET